MTALLLLFFTFLIWNLEVYRMNCVTIWQIFLLKSVVAEFLVNEDAPVLTCVLAPLLCAPCYPLIFVQIVPPELLPRFKHQSFLKYRA
jgi:hypothetical protein